MESLESKRREMTAVPKGVTEQELWAPKRSVKMDGEDKWSLRGKLE